MDAELLTSAEVIQKLRISDRTLSTLARSGTGPPFIQFGGVRRYPADLLERWVLAHMSRRRESATK